MKLFAFNSDSITRTKHALVYGDTDEHLVISCFNKVGSILPCSFSRRDKTSSLSNTKRNNNLAITENSYEIVNMNARIISSKKNMEISLKNAMILNLVTSVFFFFYWFADFHGLLAFNNFAVILCDSCLRL